MSVRIPRVEARLGVRRLPDDLTAAVVVRLASEGMTEDSDLDFKAQPWASGADGAAELAKDVAAMANSGGGLIMVSVAEVAGRASKLLSTPNDERVQRSWREILVSRFAPLVPGVEVTHLTTQTDGTGVWLLAIPASPDAPHAVRLNGTSSLVDSQGKGQNSLLWPVRNGPDTRYLSESEVSQRYRDRHARRDGDSARALALVSDATQGLAPGGLSSPNGAAYLLVSCLPSSPGSGVLDRASINTTRNWYSQRIAEGPPGLWPLGDPGIATLGRPSVVLSELSRGHGGRPTGYSHTALVLDGSGLLATCITWEPQTLSGSQVHGLGDLDAITSAAMLEHGLLAALHLLSGHALHRGDG